jgi:hypothetical protein
MTLQTGDTDANNYVMDCDYATIAESKANKLSNEKNHSQAGIGIDITVSFTDSNARLHEHRASQATSEGNTAVYPSNKKEPYHTIDVDSGYSHTFVDSSKPSHS